jgi:PKD repeat protein
MPGSIAASYTYPSPGVYSITVTVTDKHNGSDAETTTSYVVVYDPSGGFVTGGGSIESPLGAFDPDPTLTGRATFGFVSKYQKGARTPSGSTEFQFRAGNFNFHSNVYEWLVVAGARGQFKGTGTVNGASGYSFLLTVTDGQVTGGGGVDKFRIKVWETANESNVVYDNSRGQADDAEAQTALAGGSIVIHEAKR